MDQAGTPGGLRAPSIDDVAAEVDRLLGLLTLDEQAGLLSGDGAFVQGTFGMAQRYNAEAVVAGAVPRLGIDGIRFTDGPRGIVMGSSTAFPVPMARGATFDPELEARVGDAIGVEARTQGANLFAGVCVNILRHPAWGRAQETYGEDSHLLAEMGVALTTGVQRHVMACVKHYAANSMEDSRMWVDVRIDDRTLHDVYLPHFRRIVEAGAASVMSAYNKVNGTWCGEHPYLLTEVLKQRWGFDGFVMSDFTMGVHSCATAVNAGQDLEMPYRWRFRGLRRAVERGKVSRERLDDAARRLLGTQLRFREVGEPDRYVPEVVAGPDHRALAREVAAKSIVLLRNQPVTGADGRRHPMLPLDPAQVRRVAVIGRLARTPVTGDHGSSWVRAPEVVTVLDGLIAAGAARGVEIVHDDGLDPAAAATLAASADATLAVVGCTHRDEGERIGSRGGDRASLRLRPDDEALLAELSAASEHVAVALIGGSAFVTEAFRHRVGALLVAWYPGMEGGHAVADVIFGAAVPGGRLPCTWPRHEYQLPTFRRLARRVRYGPTFGYRLMEHTRSDPAFWFGSGLGYTTTALEIAGPVTAGPPPPEAGRSADGRVEVTVPVQVRNTGERAGVEVVQLYAPERLGTEERPLRTLRGFIRIEVQPGEHQERHLEALVPPGTTTVFVGTSADPTTHVAVPVPAPSG